MWGEDYWEQKGICIRDTKWACKIIFKGQQDLQIMMRGNGYSAYIFDMGLGKYKWDSSAAAKGESKYCN